MSETSEGVRPVENPISEVLKTRVDYIRDIPIYKNGSLIGLRQKILNGDQEPIIDILDQQMIIVGGLVTANIKLFREANNQDNRSGNHPKTDQEIKQSLYLGDKPIIEKLLTLTFWANKMAKTFRDAVDETKDNNGESKNYTTEYFKKCEEWSYETKQELLSTMAFVLLKDNYQQFKSWGFERSKKGQHILFVDYPGYNNTFSFHLELEKILPQNIIDAIQNKEQYQYPFEFKLIPNSLSFKLNNEEKDKLLSIYNSPDFSKKTTKEKHRILVGLGKIEKLPDIHQSKSLPTKVDGITLNEDFITAECEAIRDKMVNLILQNHNTVYIQKGNNLNINAARHGLKEWWSKNYPNSGELIFEDKNSGEIVKDAVNLNNGKINDENNTALIIGSEMGKIMGSKSTVQTLSKLGVYFPEQIIEYANHPQIADLSIDPEYGYSYANNESYLTDEKLFEFAERHLLDKKLSSEDINYFGLQEAVKLQQQIYNEAMEKISDDVLFNCPDDEDSQVKIAIVSEFIKGGSNVAFRNKNCTYFVSFEVKDDGFTFACVTNRFLELVPVIPTKVIQKIQSWKENLRSKGKEGKKIYIGDDSRLITAGGAKDPNFSVKFSDIFPNYESGNYTNEDLANKLKQEFLDMFNASN